MMTMQIGSEQCPVAYLGVYRFKPPKNECFTGIDA